jgi:cytochrome c oxidase subunit 3
MKKVDHQNNLAMTMVLISGGMLFATLFMGYAIYRSSATVWPPVGMGKVDLTLPLISTVVIALSSYFMHQTTKAIRLGNKEKTKMEFNFTFALGIIFMLIQSYFWFALKKAGFYVSSGIFTSIIYAYTWIHALHVVFGLVALLWLRWKISRSENFLQTAVNTERFWHFLGIIWGIMFLTIFVF